MKVRGSLAQITKKCLNESLTPDMLERVAKDIFPEYDLRARTGFTSNVPLTGPVAASRIVDDAVDEGRYLLLVERLARLDREGFMGRAYRISGLRELIKGVEAEGYLWDAETEHLMEDPRIRRTPNWGRLLEGEEFRFSLLRVDIVQNSQIVKVHGESAARDAFEDLRSILARVVELRSGRVWSWQGDGALAGFLFGHSTTASVLAGMALLHELFLYDRLHNRIGQPLKVRAAVHTGPLRYRDDPREIMKQETTREVLDMESRFTPPGALAISPAVAPTLDRVILDRFRPADEDSSRLLLYEVRLGGS
ncbi:MAG TPA: hypothetical protein VMC79_04110 [Rectinemataceae bacterium]|nr:hypothetical protein [Rectinemataceae bacterium]